MSGSFPFSFQHAGRCNRITSLIELNSNLNKCLVTFQSVLSVEADADATLVLLSYNLYSRIFSHFFNQFSGWRQMHAQH